MIDAVYMEKGIIKKTDVVIIGGGVTGCTAARTLSQYDLKIVVVEKESDICEGTTKANNGMIRSGYDSRSVFLLFYYFFQKETSFKVLLWS